MHESHERHRAPTCASSPGIARARFFDSDAFERAVANLLHACGIDANCVHTSKTPARVRELWHRRLLGGYALDPVEILGGGIVDAREDLVMVRGIAMYGVCPHHLVPFRGIAHVAYLPGGRLHGFGRIAKLVDAIGQRLTYQEWATRDIAEAMVMHGKARGAACVIEAEHLCLLLGEDRRGDERVYTQAFAGSFNHQDAHLRHEVLQAARKWPTT